MRSALMLAAVSVFVVTPCLAQAPAMWQGEQTFPISVEDCTRMAKRVLERQGYQAGTAGGNWVYGSRDIHRALIQCRAEQDGTWANVVVASNAQEAAVAGSEEKLLMNSLAGIMRNPRVEPPPGSYRNSCQEIEMNGDDLYAQCRARDGQWVRTRLDHADQCGDIGNNNGQLTCNQSVDHDDRDSDRDRDRDRRPDWFSMTSQQPLPANVVPGGQEPNHATPQYVCRAQQDGNWVPGKTVTAFGTDCLIAYHDMEIRKTSFDILTGDPDDYAWMAPNIGRPPLYTGNEGGAQLRSCRFELYVNNSNKGRHLGKEAGGKCVVSYKGGAYSSDRYEVLYRQ